MAAMDLPPQPRPDVDTQPFWDAAGERELRLCRCLECRRWLHPPLERCPVCGSATAFEEVAGTGRLWSFIVERRGSVAGYLDAVPYVVGLIELDDQPGLRFPSLLLDVDPAALTIGQPMAVDFVPLPGGSYTLPVFRPVAA